MANHFPDSVDAKVTGVLYGLMLTDSVAAGPGSVQAVPVPAPQLAFQFQSSYDADGNLTVDYGSFDQDQAEAGYAALLNFMMTTLGIDPAEWAGKVRVQRFWTFRTSNQALVIQVSAQDVMPYTPAPVQ